MHMLIFCTVTRTPAGALSKCNHLQSNRGRWLRCSQIIRVVDRRCRCVVRSIHSYMHSGVSALIYHYVRPSVVRACMVWGVVVSVLPIAFQGSIRGERIRDFQGSEPQSVNRKSYNWCFPAFAWTWKMASYRQSGTWASTLHYRNVTLANNQSVRAMQFCKKIAALV
jgi:hypothetical protein